MKIAIIPELFQEDNIIKQAERTSSKVLGKVRDYIVVEVNTDKIDFDTMVRTMKQWGTVYSVRNCLDRRHRFNFLQGKLTIFKVLGDVESREETCYFCGLTMDDYKL